MSCSVGATRAAPSISDLRRVLRPPAFRPPHRQRETCIPRGPARMISSIGEDGVRIDRRWKEDFRTTASFRANRRRGGLAAADWQTLLNPPATAGSRCLARTSLPESPTPPPSQTLAQLSDHLEALDRSARDAHDRGHGYRGGDRLACGRRRISRRGRTSARWAFPGAS